MASLAPITDVSYDIYFNILHGLTTDMEKIKSYKDRALKNSGDNKRLVTQFNQILKFAWSEYLDNKCFPIVLARETDTRNVKILGFLNIAKVLLLDPNSPERPIIANPDEVIKILKNIDTKGKGK